MFTLEQSFSDFPSSSAVITIVCMSRLEEEKGTTEAGTGIDDDTNELGLMFGFGLIGELELSAPNIQSVKLKPLLLLLPPVEMDRGGGTGTGTGGSSMLLVVPAPFRIFK